MLIHYLAPSGDVLLTRPQTAPPREGERVTVQRPGHCPQHYRVACVVWLLPLEAPPRRWYSMTDEAEVVVRVLLREDEG